MGTGGLLFAPGGGIRGNVSLNGNVGIGKTNPTATLDVSGFLNASGVVQAGFINNRAVELATNTNFAYIDFHSLDTQYNDYDSRISSSNGTAGTIGRGDLEFEANKHTFSTIGSMRMTIANTGGVGIGISSPGATLDVSGVIRARGEIQMGADNAFQIERSTDGNKTLLIEHFSNPAANVCFINNLTGGGGKTLVGIDITAPLFPLDVSGICRIGNCLNIRAPGETSTRSASIESTLTDLYILNQKAGSLRFGTNNAEDMRIDVNGNVGIGKMNPTSALDVSGTIKTNLVDTQNFDISMGTGMLKFGNNNASLSSTNLVFSSWTGNFTSFVDNPLFFSITYGNGQFVAVGSATSTNGRVATSLDGTTWNRIPMTTGSWIGVACSPNGLFVAVGNSGSNRSMYSTNATSWTTFATPNTTAMSWSDVCHGGSLGNEQFVAVADNGTAGLGRVMTSAYSASAITGWTQRNSSDNTISWNGVCYGYTSSGQGLYVAVGSGGTLNRSMYSTDEGVTWIGKATPNNLEYFKVCYGNGTFVAIAGTASLQNGLRVIYTRNIITEGWSAANYPTENQWMSITYGDGLFVAVSKNGIGNRVMTSLDGINWTIRSTSGLDYIWNSVSYGNGRFVAVAYSGPNGIQTMINIYSAPCIELNGSGYSINLNSSSIYLGNYTVTNSGFTPNTNNVSALGTTTTRWTAVYAVNGTIQTSDSLLKIYEPLAYGITQIKQIETIKFKWKETPNEKEKDFEYFGFKAENLRDIFPELVYDEDENNGVPLQVNYNEILPVCVNAIQEQQETIESQKSIIESLQEQLQTFEQRLSALESK